MIDLKKIIEHIDVHIATYKKLARTATDEVKAAYCNGKARALIFLKCELAESFKEYSECDSCEHKHPTETQDYLDFGKNQN